MISSRGRRVVWFTAGMVAAWIVAAWVGAWIAQPGPDQLPGTAFPAGPVREGWALHVARAVVAGITAGLIASFLELKVLPRYALRVGTGTLLLLRTAVYSVVGLITVSATVRFVARAEFGVSPREFFSSDGFQTFLRSPDFGALILTFVIASFLISGALQVARLLGPRTLAQILLGRYVRPVHEERTFLFVDLADSTGIAERLGPLRFAEFKNEFFHDLAEPVLDARGQIVQYVGDEVMLTWPASGGASRMPGDCVRCYFALRERIRTRAHEYEASYGVVPRFRGGLHAGPVVVSQLGDLKREIGFSGDAVNTASRLQELCKELGHDFLASGDVLSRITLPAGIRTQDLGNQHLRGRDRPITVMALDDRGS